VKANLDAKSEGILWVEYCGIPNIFIPKLENCKKGK